MKFFLYFLFILFSFLFPQHLLASYEDSTVTYRCVNGGEVDYELTETKYVYDSTGNIKTYFSYFIDQNVHNLLAIRHYEYDLSGNLLTQTDSSWGYSGQLSNALYQYTYDIGGRVLSYSVSSYSYGVQQPDERTEYIYDLSGNLVMETYFRGLPLDTNKRSEYQYDAYGFISSEIKSVGSPLVLSTRQIYENNGTGNDTLSIFYHWNGTAWDDSVKTLNIYQSNDTIRIVSYVQQVQTNLWSTISFDTLIYDVGNFLLEDIFYEIDSGVVDTISRYIYTYTSQVPLVYHFSEDYYYTPNTWGPDSWTDNEYDLAGNLVYRYGSCYGCGYGESNYYYDPVHNLLSGYYSYGITHGGLEDWHNCNVYYYDIHGDFTLCQTDTLTLYADSGFVSYQWSTGETTSSIRVHLPGTYMVYLHDSTGFVWQGAPHTVGMKAPPVASHATDSVMNVCRNENNIRLEEIDLPSYNYQWLLNDQPLGTYYQYRNYLFVYPNSSPEGNYRVRVSNECGFDTSSTTTIHFSPSAVPTITPGPNVSICQGDTLTITATGGSHYNWIPTFDTTSSIQTIFPGVYQVRIFDIPDCYTTRVCTVATDDFSQAYIRQSNDTILSYYNYGNGYSYSWSWLLNGDTIAGAHSYQLTVSQNGSYSLILTSSGGCVDTIGPYNYVLGGMTLFAGADVSKCSGNTAYIGVNANTTHARPPYNYSWTKDGNFLTSGTTSSNWFQANFLQTTSVVDTIECILTVTDSTNTTVSDTQLVILYPNPTDPPVITGASMDSVCRSVTSLLTASPPGNYRWYHDGISYTSVLPDYWIANAPASYTCAYIDIHGCISPQSAPYVIYSHPAPPQPVITVNGTSPTCWGDSIQLVTLWDSSLSYTWGGSYSTETYPTDTNVFYANYTSGYHVTTMNSYGCTNFSSMHYLEFDSLPSFPITVYLPTVLCYGDSVELISNSFPGYTYQWMKDDIEIPGATDTFYYAKETGYHFLKITNSAGCSAGSEKWLIQERPENTITVIQLDSLFSSNAFFTSTFQWYDDNIFLTGEDSSIFIAHQSGEYLVEVTDYHGCVVYSDTFPIDCHLQLTVQPVQCHDDCNGLLSVASNAIHPFNLMWSNGDSTLYVDSLCAGAYWVTISDAWGCFDSISYDLINPDPLLVLLQDSLTLNCFGGCDTIEAFASGGAGGFIYQWSDGSSDSQAFVCDTTPISLSVTDMNGCSDFNNVTILPSIDPVFTFNSTSPSCIACADGMVTIYSQSGPAPFILLFDSVEYSIVNAGDSIQVTNLLQGWYEIQMTGVNGCTMTDSVYLDGTILSAADEARQSNFQIIPNPTTGNFSLFFSSETVDQYQIEILDYSGKTIFESKNIKAERMDMDISSWSKGIYTVRVFSTESCSARKFILN